jgi:hypothetical protein
MLELTSSSAGENKIATPGVRPDGWASTEQAAVKTTPAMSSHRVEFEKLKSISIHQATSLDNDRQK